MKPWFPNYQPGSPYSRATGQAVIGGVLPFDPYPPQYGRLTSAVVHRPGSTVLTFAPTLQPLPDSQECLTESVQTVYVLFRGTDGTVAADEGWVVEHLEAYPGWPGVAYAAHTPADLEGRSVSLQITGDILRIVSLHVWRGETCGAEELPDPGGGGGDPQ